MLEIISVSAQKRVSHQNSVLAQEQNQDGDGSAGEFGSLAQLRLILGGHLHVGGVPALAPHQGLGGILTDLLHIAQQQEQSQKHKEVHAYKHGEKGAVHRHAHHQLGDELLGRPGSESQQRGVTGNADGADRIQLQFLCKDHADGHYRDQGVRAAEAAQINHQHEHNRNQDIFALILQLVNGPVEQLVDGARGHDHRRHRAGSENCPDHQAGIAQALKNQHEHPPRSHRILMPQVGKLVAQNLSVLIHGELSGRDYVGQQTCKQQQSHHNPKQMGHLKTFLCLFPCTHSISPLFII